MAQHEDYYFQKHHQSKLDHSANFVLSTDQYPTLKAAIPLSYSYLDKRNNFLCPWSRLLVMSSAAR